MWFWRTIWGLYMELPIFYGASKYTTLAINTTNNFKSFTLFTRITSWNLNITYYFSTIPFTPKIIPSIIGFLNSIYINPKLPWPNFFLKNFSIFFKSIHFNLCNFVETCFILIFFQVYCIFVVNKLYEALFIWLNQWKAKRKTWCFIANS